MKATRGYLPWLAALLLAALLPAGDVTLLSQNVWFDDASGKAGRYRLLVDELAGRNADAIALQEVTPALLAELDAQAAGRGWQVAADREGIARGYSCAILARHPLAGVRAIALPSRMGRRALVAEATVGGRRLRLISIHLDSMPEDTERRILQLQTLRQLQTDDAWVLLGDCNFGDGEPEVAALAGLVDAGAADPTPTYDVTGNALAARTRFPDEPSRRLDHILAPAGAIFADYRVLRTERSDHFGVMVVFREARR